MPYGRQICVEDREEKRGVLEKKLKYFAKEGYQYKKSDLRWRHKLEAVDGELFLVDLESLEKHGLEEKEQIDKVVKEQLERLMDRK